MGQKGQALLRIQNLSITFSNRESEVEAVKGLSFELGQGERLGIVGESGSGKSVTALALLGLLPPGTVKAQQMAFSPLEGPVSYPLDRLDPKTWRELRGKQIAMIFQEPMSALNPVLRCGQQIGEVIRKTHRLTGKSVKARVMEWLEKVQVKDTERIHDSYPHQLSGGQQQRVMIAMALAGEPQLLIADEPTTALDVRVQAEILDLLNRLCRETGSAMLFISHDLSVVAQMTDRVLVMRGGELVESGPTASILQQPSASYTQALLACRPRLDRRVARLATFHTPEQTIKKPKDFQTGEPLLRVNQASVLFQNRKKGWGQKTGVKALQEVSLELKEGEILGLVGESGSGKTTLGRSIMKMQALSAGQMTYRNRLLAEWSAKEYAREVQMIFQNPYAALNPRMIVGEAIQEVLRVHGMGADEWERKEQVLALLRQLQLSEDHYDRLPHEFSGGQRQRLCIARALALRPRFLICDECTASLDVSIQAEILNLLADLRAKEGLSMLFISHDLAAVHFLCDRVMVMREGRIVESGLVDEVVQSPQHPYTRSLIQAIPSL